jgi:L-ascorbate metabolism protein UlaG (beta-lactamase superfamily)
LSFGSIVRSKTSVKNNDGYYIFKEYFYMSIKTFANSALEKSVDAFVLQPVTVQLIRNATIKVRVAGTTFLIDPMLDPKGAWPGFSGTFHSEKNNPLVDLPLSIEEILADVDAVIVTHTHPDHWDKTAQQQLPKNIPLFVQNDADCRLITSQGFNNVRILQADTQFNAIQLTPVTGQHGTEEMYRQPELAARLGQTIGVVITAEAAKSVYVVGDTVWCPAVDQAIAAFSPQIIILNAGYAQFKAFSGSIIMGQEDIEKALKRAPKANIVAIHLEAVNHATLSRRALSGYLERHNIAAQVAIPVDGETLML